MNEKNKRDFEKFWNDLNSIFGSFVCEKNEREISKPHFCNKQKSVKDFYEDYKSHDNYKGFEMTNIADKNGNSIGVQLTYLVPGVDKKDLHVSVEENICIVNCDETVKFFGKLDSKVKMKFDVDYDKIESKLENGVLIIRLYRKKIDVKTVKVDIM